MPDSADEGEMAVRLAFRPPYDWPRSAAISAVPGCGPWTAKYVALRGLGDPDAFPASDLVLRRVAGAPGRPWSEAALTPLAEQWRPWRGYAVMHLWQPAAP
jgi:AraC family transcriptional regulator of adaptative response / DNA-3-methyladenine glycosylase II